MGHQVRAMILAAGRGERMGDLTASTPKPLLPIGGETLIDRQLHRLAGAGINEVVINLAYLGEQISEAVGDGSRYGLRVTYSPEPPGALEAGGGIVEALPLLGRAPFLLINADVVSDFDLGRLANQTPSGLGVLVMVPNPSHNPNGDFGLEPSGRLTLDPPRLTYAGIARLAQELFAGLPAGRRALKPLLDGAIAAGQLDGVRHGGLWLDVGTPERLVAAEAALVSGSARVQ